MKGSPLCLDRDSTPLSNINVTARNQGLCKAHPLTISTHLIAVCLTLARIPTSLSRQRVETAVARQRQIHSLDALGLGLIDARAGLRPARHRRHDGFPLKIKGTLLLSE